MDLYGQSLEQVRVDVDSDPHLGLDSEPGEIISRTIPNKNLPRILGGCRGSETFLPEEKSLKVVKAVSSLMEPRDCSRRQVMRVLCLICIPEVPWAQLHSRELQFFLLSSWDKKEGVTGRKGFHSSKGKSLLKLVAGSG